ncbi:MAG: hypothetical protein ACOCPQ_00210 [Desulfosudaceae bacterium]
MPTIFIKDSLRAAVEAASGGHQTVLYNEKGYPGYFYVVPKFRYEDLGYDGDMGTGVCTAFLVGGKEKSELFIGAYQAAIKDDCALPLPSFDPAASIDWDEAKSACEANGAGYHMMTVHEWAALALWCMSNDFEPRGNTDYGRAHDATYEVGRRQDEESPGVDSGTARVLAGSGPAAWRHNNDYNGISDLVGNIWEWQSLMKLVDGRIIVATDNDYEQAEDDWSSQDAYLDSTEAEGDGDVVLSHEVANPGDEESDNSASVTWGDMTTTSEYSSIQLLKRLLIEPAGVIPQGKIYARNYGERFPRRGGNWRNGSNAGLAALYLTNERSHSSSNIGVRPAFVS